jgi:hypothetical protein
LHDYKPTLAQQTIGYIAQHLETSNRALCANFGPAKHDRSARAGDDSERRRRPFTSTHGSRKCSAVHSSAPTTTATRPNTKPAVFRASVRPTVDSLYLRASHGDSRAWQRRTAPGIADDAVLANDRVLDDCLAATSQLLGTPYL